MNGLNDYKNPWQFDSLFDEFPSGKHEGDILANVMDDDPQYIMHLLEAHVKFSLGENIRRQVYDRVGWAG